MMGIQYAGFFDCMRGNDFLYKMIYDENNQSNDDINYDNSNLPTFIHTYLMGWLLAQRTECNKEIAESLYMSSLCSSIEDRSPHSYIKE